jgi:hypothetical protein
VAIISAQSALRLEWDHPGALHDRQRAALGTLS